MKKLGFFARASVLVLLWLSACTPSPSADAEKHKRESLKFLVENEKKPGIVSTPSGLQYQVLNEGNGISPKATDTVLVNYRGSLISGQEFDRGENVKFPLNGVIRGWTEGLQLMKEGAKYRFFIPPELAYGARGAGRVIPPNAALIFDVELLKVNP
ncbi:FKBP-type peptidyl-prolyl cis-trans isomerase [Methylocaldum szegediense]|uniref:Peptidyl-prolyl cis-trans isomerase n=1 Tax=Methylocaldum szegediense TaxID=73780 RepID=A0ABM9I5W3_9GAMM|nr:FKBP-type peptidyl-prolyl cis-trans isomerase [Methylocaldum szegediense]CAI8911648.1 FKBP-type peptidyl-prolyl cis-trans isomerase FkpA [Methylocaldum szegediense]